MKMSQVATHYVTVIYGPRQPQQPRFQRGRDLTLESVAPWGLDRELEAGK